MRTPFFRVGERWFIDLTWNFGEEPMLPDRETFEQLVATVPAAEIVVARQMTPKEVGQLHEARASSDEEAFSRLITKDELRWTGRRRR